jgi:hypothetical protein
VSKPHNPPDTMPPPDAEAVLFARLIARVLSWPCPICGRPGLCDCFAPVMAGREAETQTADGQHER